MVVCKFLISFCEWGNFGYQKVRSVLNRAIVNHFASNLDCAHDFKISPPAKEGRPVAANLCPFWHNDHFWGQFLSPNFFLPNFFLPKCFFTPKFFYPNSFLPNFFLPIFFFFFGTFFFFLTKYFLLFFLFFTTLTTFHRRYRCYKCMLQHVLY